VAAGNRHDCRSGQRGRRFGRFLAVKKLIAASVLALAAPVAVADDGPAFKFTAGVYRFSGGGADTSDSLDLNLRHTSDFGNLWLGWFRWPHEHFSQARGGWDRTFDLGAVRVQPSVQLASGGFAGGSLYAETGDSWFAGAGIGRTNLKPYVNLNFDPNDAWTLAAGYRWAGSRSLAFTVVGDNRENPDQRHFHIQYRTPVDGQRLVVDLLLKRGLVDNVLVHRAGLSVGYDWPRFFVRVAWDPKVNFTPQDMLRVQAGTRF
jgi:hypothetical protein